MRFAHNKSRARVKVVRVPEAFTFGLVTALISLVHVMFLAYSRSEPFVLTRSAVEVREVTTIWRAEERDNLKLGRAAKPFEPEQSGSKRRNELHWKSLRFCIPTVLPGNARGFYGNNNGYWTVMGFKKKKKKLPVTMAADIIGQIYMYISSSSNVLTDDIVE